ncbi:hypothetical protein B0H12DRAFT_435779 [Mycena haematopus]|nr:hypothetical protein B0H12DRAFT_435779 [Mycena haematopus]
MNLALDLFVSTVSFVFFTFVVFSLFSVVTSAPASPAHVVPRTTGSTFPTPVASAVVPTEIRYNGYDTNSTGYLFATQQLSGVQPHPTSTLFVRQLDNSTIVQQSSAATSSIPAVVVLFVDGGDTLSSRVLASIIIGFAIFVACYVSFCCFWRCGRRSRPQLARPPLARPPPRAPRLHPPGTPSLQLVIALTRTAANIWTAPTASAASNRRLSSLSDTTLTPGSGDRPDGGPAKYSIDQCPDSATGRQSVVDEIEMAVPPLVSPPAAYSRPRMPLMEAAGAL